MAEEIQKEVVSGENTDDLVRRFAIVCDSIYQNRTAGDYTWAGVLYHFLDEYREQVGSAWAEIDEESEPTSTRLLALYESPLIEVYRQYGDDGFGSNGIHELTFIEIALFPSQEATFMEILEKEFGRIT